MFHPHDDEEDDRLWEVWQTGCTALCLKIATQTQSSTPNVISSMVDGDTLLSPGITYIVLL